MVVLVHFLQAPLAIIFLLMVGAGELKASVENPLLAEAATPGGCGCPIAVYSSQIDHF